MPAAKLLPLPQKGTGSFDWWKGQLEWATEIRKKQLPIWRRQANAYRGALRSLDAQGIRVNIEYEKTEQKRPQLMFRLPALKLRPSARTIRESYPAANDGTPDLTQAPIRDLRKAVAIFREVLTYQLGPKCANTKALMNELIFDVLCPSGIGFAKIGFEQYTHGTVPIQIGTEQRPNVGDVLGLGATIQVPLYAPAPNIIAEKYYAARISPARGFVPAEFMGSDFNLAEFLGWDFYLTEELATARGWNVAGAGMSANDSGTMTQEDRIVPLDDGGRRKGQLRCRELFYHPQRLGLDDHPDKIRRLVFVGDLKDPVIHEDYKDQQFDARGRWIGGLKNYPIKVFTLRYVSDCAHPPSDCVITQRPSDELADYRTLEMKLRRKAVPRVAVNIDAFPNEAIKEKFLAGEHFDDIPVNSGAELDRVARAIDMPHLPPENRIGEAEIKNDIDRAWALGANSSSVREGGDPTATEIASIAQATANRLGGEREATVQFWLSLAEGMAALIQLHANNEDYVEIVGTTGAKEIAAWNKETIAGEFLFEAIPDSSLAPDAAADRELALGRYNLLANDPTINREQLVRETVEAYGGDPDRLVHPLPQPPPEKPKINLTFNGKDLDPTAPQYGNVSAILMADGVLSTPVVAPTPMEPTGPADVVDREHLRMVQSDNRDQRSPAASALVGTPVSAS